MLPPCDSDALTCCDSLWTAADALLTIAWTAFEECVPEDLCNTVEHFVAAAEPHLVEQDYLSVYLVSVDLNVPRGSTAQTKGLTFQKPTVTYAVKLKQGGYPMLEEVGTTIQEPTAADIAFVSTHFLSQVEKIYRGVLNGLAENNACGALRAYTPVRIIGPSGGAVGMSFNVTTDIEWL